MIVATQMLESMIDSPAPTRAECSDVATAIFDGCDAIMLSGESAAGKYPEESVRMQQRLVRRVEASTRHQELVRMGNIGGYEPPHGETDTDAVVEARRTSRGPSTPSVCWSSRGRARRRGGLLA